VSCELVHPDDRLSVLGFLGAAQPDIIGNYGFKDCWLGLEWVRDNIEAFGGDPNQVHLSGLSGGGHIVGQLLHHAGRMAPAKVRAASIDLIIGTFLYRLAAIECGHFRPGTAC